MKRGGFKPRYERRPERQMDDYTPKPRAVAVAVSDGKARMVVQVPKRVYVRSEALLVACRLLACQHCGAQDGTVVAAHSNWAEHGKCKSIKADDNRVASLCFRCHSMLDQGTRWTAEQRQAAWWLAHCKTVTQLVAIGAWPAGVPVPDIEHCPFDLSQFNQEPEECLIKLNLSSLC